MQRLICLGLEGQPASEVIELTAQVWVERLEHIDPTRLRIAFEAVEVSAFRWPTIADVMEALPKYAHVYEQRHEQRYIEHETKLIELDPIEQARYDADKKRAEQAIADCAKRLGIELVQGERKS
jgi:hypothetical protein